MSKYALVTTEIYQETHGTDYKFINQNSLVRKDQFLIEYSADIDPYYLIHHSFRSIGCHFTLVIVQITEVTYEFFTFHSPPNYTQFKTPAWYSFL